MKNNLIYAGLMLAAMSSVSCNESLPNHFGAIEGVYFNNVQINNTHIDQTALTFIYEDGDQLEVPIKVQLVGRPSSVDRPVVIRVHSENAALDTDYTLPAAAVLPANATSFDYLITLRRTAVLKNQIKSLVVTLEANEHFTIPFTTLTATDGTKSSVVNFLIEFSDQFTAPPAGWEADFVGAFSQQKFELLCTVLEMPRGDFSETGKISSAKWLYMQTTIIGYIQDQVDLKAAGKPYDQNAFDKHGNPLVFKSNS